MSFEIVDLYQDYEILVVKAKRAINADASRRGAVEEVLIRRARVLAKSSWKKVTPPPAK